MKRGLGRVIYADYQIYHHGEMRYALVVVWDSSNARSVEGGSIAGRAVGYTH